VFNIQTVEGSGASDVGSEFSNAIISDLGPLIALFGEQVTKQFMSQSMSWWDHILFGMAPLGIITAIVGAIRVGGPTWMKAIIGRARESRGLAEVELMSSTSHDVCELWDGSHIVRVMGDSPVVQLLYFPHLQLESETCGLYNLKDAFERGYLVAKADLSFRDRCKSLPLAYVLIDCNYFSAWSLAGVLITYNEAWS